MLKGFENKTMVPDPSNKISNNVFFHIEKNPDALVFTIKNPSDKIANTKIIVKKAKSAEEAFEILGLAGRKY